MSRREESRKQEINGRVDAAGAPLPPENLREVRCRAQEEDPALGCKLVFYFRRRRSGMQVARSWRESCLVLLIFSAK